MKIRGISFKEHPFFGTLWINFVCANGYEPLNTVVIGGINGSGKTTLLEAVVAMMTGPDNHDKVGKSTLDIELSSLYHKGFIGGALVHMGGELTAGDDEDDTGGPEPGPEPKEEWRKEWWPLVENGFNVAFKGKRKLLADKFKAIEESKRPKLVYMPAEIDFSKIKIDTTPYSYKYKFYNVIDENATKDIPNYFATYIDKYVYSRDMNPSKAIPLACKEINSIFEKLDITSRLDGIKTDGSRMPLFKNKGGKQFDMNGLSSGERQLFLRITALKMMDINNSVILVDEPEISLHPSWQQRIIKVYENIGEDNQVIVATHSPHVISSVKKESVRILLPPPEVRSMDYRDLHNSYGAPVKRVLKDVMGVDSDRDPIIQEEINELQEYVVGEDFAPDEFKRRFDELEQLLGSTDEDLIRLKMAQLRREKREKV